MLDKYQRNYDTITGFVERNKEIFNPTEQAVEFLEREEALKNEVHMIKEEAKRGKENEESLLKINGVKGV